MEDLASAAETVATLMRLLTSSGGLRLRFRITAGAGAEDPDGLERRDIYVECKGPDAELLLEREGELLRALEHIAAKMLRLEPEEHDRVSFDTNGFKAERARALRDNAAAGIAAVRETGRPFGFAPMNSRERRMLHLFLRDSGLQTASSGEGALRFVVLYPEGYRIPVERRGPGAGSSAGTERKGSGVPRGGLDQGRRSGRGDDRGRPRGMGARTDRRGSF